ncbi:MAG: hypothetical protein ABR899_06440 [Candidatus Krumholzibacteriaceae bacterium]
MADFEKVIPPGKEGKVNVKIDGKKLENPGLFEKSFTVTTNDPLNKQFVLVVRGTVKRAFDLTGEMRWAGYSDEDLKIESTITNLLPVPVNITGAKWVEDSRGLKLNERIGLKVETIEKGKKFRLNIWKKKELPPDNFVAEIELATDYPKLPVKRVPIAIMVMNEVEVQPDRVIYGEMVLSPTGFKSFDRTFTITASRGDSLKILKVLPNRNDMTVKIKEVQHGKSYSGTILITPQKDRIGPYLGSIRIFTNYRRYKEINLDVVGSVRQAEQ